MTVVAQQKKTKTAQTNIEYLQRWSGTRREKSLFDDSTRAQDAYIEAYSHNFNAHFQTHTRAIPINLMSFDMAGWSGGMWIASFIYSLQIFSDAFWLCVCDVRNETNSVNLHRHTKHLPMIPHNPYIYDTYS